MKRVAASVGVGFLLLLPGLRVPPAHASAAAANPAQRPDPELDRLRAWFAAVRAHRPGVEDASLRTLATWTEVDIDAAITSADDAVFSIEAARDAAAGHAPSRPARYSARDARWRLQLEPSDPLALHPERILALGAMLHADVAMILQPTATVRAGPGFDAAAVPSVHTTDGVVRREDQDYSHWAHARRLLALAMRLPEGPDRTWVGQWYRATSAWLCRELLWSEADDHLRAARQVLPDDGRIFFYSGVVHEALASPEIQVARDASERLGVRLSVAGESKELADAASFLQQSVDLDPGFGQASLHLGRVLGELGRHEEAVKALTRAGALLTDEEQRYFVNLFLGGEQAALNHRDAAHEAFMAAATAYPHAQAPWLGLSQLARHFDDDAELRDVNTHLLPMLAEEDRYRADPWWSYIDAHVRDADALVDDVRRALAGWSGP